MAKALKDEFGPEVPRSLARDLKKAWRAFPEKPFLETVLAGFESLELMARVRHVASGLSEALPDDYLKATGIVSKALGPPLEKTEGNGLWTFRYLPYGFWVAEEGQEHPEESLALQLELTRRCTSEFSVRSFLIHHPEITLKFLETLVDHPCPHVRRWVSEGTRPHLPWGKGVPELSQNPEGHLHLLESLKDDPHTYVRKSVANHLNDLSRQHPDLLLRIAKRWNRGAGEGRAWILRQGLRNLLKRGDQRALGILGYGREPSVELDEISVKPGQVNMGEEVRVEWKLRSTGKKSQSVMVDLVVHYPRPGGKEHPKTFKLKALDLRAGESMAMKKKISLKELSTRKHHPGQHRLILLINGRHVPLGSFELLG